MTTLYGDICKELITWSGKKSSKHAEHHHGKLIEAKAFPEPTEEARHGLVLSLAAVEATAEPLRGDAASNEQWRSEPQNWEQQWLQLASRFLQVGLEIGAFKVQVDSVSSQATFNLLNNLMGAGQQSMNKHKTSVKIPKSERILQTKTDYLYCFVHIYMERLVSIV